MKVKLKLALRGLLAVGAGVVIYYLALTMHSLPLYALSFALLGLAPTCASVRKIYMYDADFAEWYYSFRDAFGAAVRAIIVALAALTVAIHRDLLALFVGLAAGLPAVLSRWVPEGAILPSILIAAGVAFDVGLWTRGPQAAAGSVLLLRVALQVLSLALIVPSALYIARKYYERKERPFLAMSAIISVGLLLLGLGTLLSFPVLPFPANYVVCLGWGSVITFAAGYDLISYIMGRSWSTAVYSGDYVEEARAKVAELLDKIGAKYVVRRRGFPSLRYEFRISSPFRGRIIVRRWRHWAIIRGREAAVPVPVGEPGLMIEVSPGPKRAPPELRRLMVELLGYFNLPTADWERATG